MLSRVTIVSALAMAKLASAAPSKPAKPTAVQNMPVFTVEGDLVTVSESKICTPLPLDTCNEVGVMIANVTHEIPNLYGCPGMTIVWCAGNEVVDKEKKEAVSKYWYCCGQDCEGMPSRRRVCAHEGKDYDVGVTYEIDDGLTLWCTDEDTAVTCKRSGDDKDCYTSRDLTPPTKVEKCAADQPTATSTATTTLQEDIESATTAAPTTSVTGSADAEVVAEGFNLHDLLRVSYDTMYVEPGRELVEKGDRWTFVKRADGPYNAVAIGIHDGWFGDVVRAGVCVGHATDKAAKDCAVRECARSECTVRASWRDGYYTGAWDGKAVCFAAAANDEGSRYSIGPEFTTAGAAERVALSQCQRDLESSWKPWVGKCFSLVSFCRPAPRR